MNVKSATMSFEASCDTDNERWIRVCFTYDETEIKVYV